MESVADTGRRARARAAIEQVARSRGLPTGLNVLSERWNTVVELGSSGVIAKATTLADLAKSDPVHWYQQEVDVCGSLAAAGAPVHRPLAQQQPVAVVDGFAVTLWQKVDGQMGECSEEQLVSSLAHLHRAGASLVLNQPWFATITTHFDDVMPKLRARKTLPATTLDVLGQRAIDLLEAVQRADLPTGFIHGDAQRKNAMQTAYGAVWIDLEECSVGPYAWDIACLTMNRRFDEQRVLDRYEALTGEYVATPAEIAKLKELRDLEGLTWMLAIQDEREPEFRTEAETLVAEVLTRISDD